MSKSHLLETLKLVPHVLFIMWNFALFIIGSAAVSDDWELRTTHCGQESHIFKFAVLNLAFGSLDIVTYLFFPGGGEGARARAIVITSMHFAMAVWGTLLWLKLDALCSSVLAGHYKLIFTYHHMATIGNAVCFVFMALHEGYLGEKLGYDQTLRPQSDGCHHNCDKVAAQGQQLPHAPFADVQDVPKSAVGYQLPHLPTAVSSKDDPDVEQMLGSHTYPEVIPTAKQ